MTSLASERRVVAGGTAKSDLFLHALAQLPDEVELTLSATGAERQRLEALARAYGINDRVEIAASAAAGAAPEFSTMAELVESLASPDDPPSSSARAGASLDGERIALVTNIPAPYRLPLFGAMHDRLSAEGAAFRVFFLADTSERSWMNATPDGFDYDVLSSIPLPIGQRRPLVPANLERRLAGFRPTIVVGAGLSPFVSMRAGMFARRRAIPFGIWSGEHATMATARSRLRRLQRQRLVRLADFGIAYGFYAAEYLRPLRPELPVVYGRNTSVSAAQARTTRGGGPVELLAVGDLASPRKGIDIALEALQHVPDLDCRLTVVGGGAMQKDLVQTASRDERIRFLGALSPADVQLEYARADVFVFPSRADIFGLALVEAMAAGLATITASNPGAVGDLPVDGHNAVIVDGHDPAVWAESIRRVVEDDQLQGALGDAAARTVGRRWTMAHAADAMLAGLRLGSELQRGSRP
jgi:glycosyltransferase involved in cell wall biosynthesis